MFKFYSLLILALLGFSSSVLADDNCDAVRAIIKDKNQTFEQMCVKLSNLGRTDGGNKGVDSACLNDRNISATFDYCKSEFQIDISPSSSCNYDLNQIKNIFAQLKKFREDINTTVVAAAEACEMFNYVDDDCRKFIEQMPKDEYEANYRYCYSDRLDALGKAVKDLN